MKKFLLILLKSLVDVKNFCLCFLRKDCPYAIKRLLAISTFFLITYLAIFTDKDYIELLGFVAVLLGIASYDKITYNKFNKNSNEDNNAVNNNKG